MTRRKFKPESKEDEVKMPICFTADSIFYLDALQLPINLDDWVWHEEMVNGDVNLIITDKRAVILKPNQPKD